MELKERIQAKIEKDSVISEINGRKVILKESAGIFKLLGKNWSKPLKEWKEINPPITENGKIHYINLIFGGWRNFFVLVMLAIIIAMAFMQYFSVLILIEQYQNHACYPTFSQCIKDAVGTPGSI